MVAEAAEACDWLPLGLVGFCLPEGSRMEGRLGEGDAERKKSMTPALKVLSCGQSSCITLLSVANIEMACRLCLLDLKVLGSSVHAILCDDRNVPKAMWVIHVKADDTMAQRVDTCTRADVNASESPIQGRSNLGNNHESFFRTTDHHTITQSRS
jgi:hypothetical protein